MKHQPYCPPSPALSGRLVLLIVLFCTGALPAQNLQVNYDLFTDSMSYYLDGQLVKNPKIRKGDRLVVHFTEYNPYLYDAGVEVDQRSDERWGGGSSIGAFQGLMPGLSRFLPGFGAMGADTGSTGLFSLFDMPLLKLGESTIQLKDLFSNARGTEQLLDEAKAQLQDLSDLQAEMAGIYKEIQVIEKAERASWLASRHLDQLLYNPQMKPSQIKKIAAEYVDLIFPGKDAAMLEVDDAFQWEERPRAKRRLLLDLQTKQRSFDEQLGKLNPVAQQLTDLDLGSPALEDFARDLRTVTGQGRQLRQQFESYLAYQTQKQGQEMTLEEMMQLQLTFRELADQPFTYDCAIQVEDEVVIVKATFTPRDTLANGQAQKIRAPKIKTVKLETRGGMRFNTGIGLGFARFFDPAQDFDVRGNTIVADDKDFVQPALTTFVHFYAENRRSFAVAGTFGLGIPLSGGNISSLNFFLGPSLLFGRSQRIVFSGGITTGPVKRLAKGLQVGDDFDPNGGDIPQQTRYELGYFVGISFNVGR